MIVWYMDNAQLHISKAYTIVVWKKFTVGYFHVKLVRDEIFLPLGAVA